MGKLISILLILSLNFPTYVFAQSSVNTDSESGSFFEIANTKTQTTLAGAEIASRFDSAPKLKNNLYIVSPASIDGKIVLKNTDIIPNVLDTDPLTANSQHSSCTTSEANDSIRLIDIAQKAAEDTTIESSQSTSPTQSVAKTGQTIARTETRSIATTDLTQTGSVSASDSSIPSVFDINQNVNQTLSREFRESSERNPASPVDSKTSRSLSEIFKTTENAVRTESTKEKRKATRAFFSSTISDEKQRVREVSYDQNEIRLDYLEKPISEFKQSFVQSFKQSENLERLLNQSSGDLSQAQRTRFQKVIQNAKDQAQQAIEIIDQNPNLFSSNENLQQAQTNANPEEAKALKEVGSLIGGANKIENADSEEALSKRILLLNGLNPEKRRNALQSLRQSFEAKAKEPLKLPHNGGVISLDQKSLSCSEFITKLLPTHLRKNELSSHSLWGIGQYIQKGYFPDPPKWNDDHQKKLIALSTQFDRINIERRESIAPGDLLVYLLPGLPNGEVYLIKSIDPKTLKAKLIRYKKKDNQNYEVVDFALSFSAPNSKTKYYRNGLTFLRLKNQIAKDCQVDLKRVKEVLKAQNAKGDRQ